MTLGFGGLNLGMTSGVGLKIWQSWRPLRQEVLKLLQIDAAWDLGMRTCRYSPCLPWNTLVPAFSYILLFGMSSGTSTNLYCWYLAFRPCWYNPAGSVHVCNESFMFLIYLHRHIPLNWNQHRIFRVFIFSNFFY